MLQLIKYEVIFKHGTGGGTLHTRNNVELLQLKLSSSHSTLYIRVLSLSSTGRPELRSALAEDKAVDQCSRGLGQEPLAEGLRSSGQQLPALQIYNMNHSGLPHMPPGVPSHQPRRQNEYHYSPSPYFAYPTYHHQQQQYYAPPPQHHYPQQWYQPHQHYQPPMPRQYMPQQPLVVSSYPHVPPAMPPMNRQPTYPPPPSRTPLPEQQSTPSVTSQPVVSSSTTPTNTSITTSTPPVPKDTPVAAAPPPVAPPAVTAPVPPQPARRMPFYPEVRITEFSSST